MKAASIQMNIIKNDKDQNLNRIEQLIGNNILDLAVLPEHFSTGYFFENKKMIDDLAEYIPEGYTTQRLLEIAKRKNCHIIGTIIEKEDGTNYITAVIAGPKSYLGKHRKRHNTIDELAFYSPGTESSVYEINGCKVGVLVCFEGWFPESARELMLKGARILCHSALIISDKTIEIMRTRAIENKVFMVISNSISTELYNGKEITFRGDSRIYDYNGNIIIEAGKQEKIIIAEIDENETVKRDLPDCKDLISEICKHDFYIKNSN